MTYFSPLCVDHVQLRARGWTRTLIANFLHVPDERETVDHWANFKGKSLYSLERVILAESNVAFKTAYDASIKRRKLSDASLADINDERSRGNEQYRTWLKTVTPEQIRREIVVKKAAGLFYEMRARGYRTPHK